MDLHDSAGHPDELRVSRYTGVKFSAHYGAITAGPPVADREQEACRRLGLRLAEWAATMIEGRKDAHPLNQSYERFSDLGK